MITEINPTAMESEAELGAPEHTHTHPDTGALLVGCNHDFAQAKFRWML